MTVLQYIKRGKANAVTITYLMEKCGSSKRDVQKQIRDLRVSGHVILSDTSGGYWLPDLKEPDIEQQLERFIQYSLSNVNSRKKAVASCEILLKQIQSSDQTTLEE